MMTEQEKLERVADVQRARLGRTLDELDARRHALVRTGRRAIAPAACALLLLGAGALALLARRVVERTRRARAPWRRFMGRRGAWRAAL